MRKFKVKPIKGVWIDVPGDEEVKLQIKPMSVFTLKKLPTTSEITIEDGWNMFNMMLIGWKGFVDEDDKPLECNEENKKMVYEYDQDLVTFAIEECNKLREQVVGEKSEIKNSSPSQDGEGTKQEK